MGGLKKARLDTVLGLRILKTFPARLGLQPLGPGLGSGPDNRPVQGTKPGVQKYIFPLPGLLDFNFSVWSDFTLILITNYKNGDCDLWCPFVSQYETRLIQIFICEINSSKEDE